jgi:hypothetical protein
MTTMILSGPGGFESQARKALEQAGLSVHEKTLGHGLPDKNDGSSDPTVGFLSCDGDDIDAPEQAIGNLNWHLRQHYDVVMRSEPDHAAEQEALLKRLVEAEVERRLSDGR